MTSIDLHQAAHHPHDEHPVILLMPQRDAGRITHILEPLIALGLLGLLYLLFIASHTVNRPLDAAPITIATATASPETALIPMIVANEAELPPMDSEAASTIDPNTTNPDATDLQLAIAEAQRTGAQALQFSDNSLTP